MSNAGIEPGRSPVRADGLFVELDITPAKRILSR